MSFSFLLSQVAPRVAHADGGFFEEEFEFEEEEETFFYEEEPLYYEEEVVEQEVFEEYDFDEEYDEVSLDEEIDVDDIEYEEFEEEVFDDYARYTEEEVEEDFEMMSFEDESFMPVVEDDMVFEDYGTFEEYTSAGGFDVGGCQISTSAAVGLDCNSWSIAFTGLMQIDAVAIENNETINVAGSSPATPVSSSYADVRRMHLGVEGTYYDNWAYGVKGIFASQEAGQAKRTTANLEEAYIAFTGYDNLTFKLGYFHMPFSLSQYTPYQNDYFMERPFFDHMARFGLMGAFAKDNNTASMMVYMGSLDEDVNGARNSTDMGVAGRFTSAFAFKGDLLLHFGFSGHYLNTNSSESKMGSIFRSSSPFSGTLPADLYGIEIGGSSGPGANRSLDNMYVLNPEFAVAMGSLGIQGEYSFMRPETVGGGTKTKHTFHLWYVQANYWLTGESNTYDAQHGTFGRVTPKFNFLGRGRGTGAIGVGARYQFAELKDRMLDFGHTRALAINMTWLPNAYTKFIAEFTRAWVTRSNNERSSPYGVQFRAQVDW